MRLAARAASALLLTGVTLAAAGCGPVDQAGVQGPSQVSAAPAKNAITAILNAGVEADLGAGEGRVKFLFDPLYDNHFGSLAEMDDALAEAIISGAAPYDRVDAVFVSHAHGDHFSAQYLNQMMAAQPGLTVIAPKQAADAMRTHALWQEGFAARLTAVELENGAPAQRLSIAGAEVEAIRTPHAGWPERHSQTHNLTYRISVDDPATGTRRVMHMGDADPDPAHFAPYESFFAEARSGVAIVPFWFLRAQDNDPLFNQTLNVQQPVGVHVPVLTPQWVEGRTIFTRPGQQITVPAS